MQSFPNIFKSSFFQRSAFFRSVTLIVFSLILFPVVAQELTVMTYNIYHGEHAAHPGESNLEDVAAVINEYQPDLVALQEVDSMTQRSARLHPGVSVDQTKELARMTRMHGYFGKAMDFDGGGYGEGILSRFPADASVHSLPVPEGGEDRSLITIEFSVDGNNLVFGGTHLCHESEVNRLAQVNAICKITSAEENPAILGGDFNFEPESTPYHSMLDCFTDAAATGMPRATYPAGKPERRIDYVFVSPEKGWKIKNVQVIDVAASDHLPVLVDLEWRGMP